MGLVGRRCGPLRNGSGHIWDPLPRHCYFTMWVVRLYWPVYKSIKYIQYTIRVLSRASTARHVESSRPQLRHPSRNIRHTRPPKVHATVPLYSYRTILVIERLKQHSQRHIAKGLIIPSLIAVSSRHTHFRCPQTALYRH